ncbi:hypothetical protein HMPREF9151_00463 [Hoylesella saccharolytica F0055]|uniref:SynChlorMet cassette protein ScmC n=1 Tax=Hoylesella saccharolytica F0055 TaxID=1127699 RepID=L1NJ08_9BACT|nr:hypothetical protein [Hoylesella saccharolytica]EKY03306.1 hypothetical protein HMPREF9151_00463 [Hoylesella saccharolytica F0055]
MDDNPSFYFKIAEFNIGITFKKSRYNDLSLIESLVPFRIKKPSERLFFHLTVDDDLKPAEHQKRDRIREFETGNGNTTVDQLANGGYQYIIKDLKENSCCLLQTNNNFSDCRCALNGNYDMRSFGLNNALMLIFAFAGSFKQTLLIHASLVRHKGYGYAFIAKSGTGKSTHVSLWLKHIPECDLMNDDNPIVRILDGKAYIYGSPWSGKTPCYRNIKAPLGAITRIDRADANSVEKLNPIESFASLLPSCSSMKWDKEIFNNVCNTITKVIETTGIYVVHCLPNREAAIICHDSIVK